MAVDDEFVSVVDNRFAAEIGQHVALVANHGAGRAADAVFGVNVGMLRSRSFGEQFSFFRSRARQLGSFLFLPKILPQEEADDQCGDEKREKVIHGCGEIPWSKLLGSLELWLNPFPQIL